ncbi:MAG: nicotinate (nicotinamide) nucleotide adenylyltransferase [Treponema sp.]|jgi:nicotinate-nucleotide adenylyltransferase|nr:nicotinate (nicotinamide) nucleotide adenylyltransferase [Treponema sp.]
MKLAILGGSFNPIHLGHLFLADAVLSELSYDRVVLVPAYRSPFKPNAPGMESGARDRLEMIAASVAGDPRLTVDACEIQRGGISYTADTVKDITRRYTPEGKLGLIIGDDLAAELPGWNKSKKIFEMANIIIARRFHPENLYVPYSAIQIANDVMEISSGMVRGKIAGNSAWRYLVPAEARAIIEERGLYGARSVLPGTRTESLAKSLIVRVEEAVRESLSLERFLHSRNTALLSWDMCRHFSSYNLDPQLGYLAGIAHDMAKPLSEKELIKMVKNDGGKISSLEKEKPSLLHGKASAILLRERFNVHNEAVLEAVSLHTEGGENMGPLAKVVYIADKIEVSREKADAFARKLAYTGDNLDIIFAKVLSENVSSLRSRKLKLSEETLRLLDIMEKMGGAV